MGSLVLSGLYRKRKRPGIYCFTWDYVNTCQVMFSIMWSRMIMSIYTCLSLCCPRHDSSFCSPLPKLSDPSVYTVLSTLGNPHLKTEGHNFVTQTMTCQNRLSLLHCKVAERAWERGWSMDEESKALVLLYCYRVQHLTL